MELCNKHTSTCFGNKNADFQTENVQKTTIRKDAVNRNESPGLTFSSFSTDYTKDSVSPDGEALSYPLFFNEDFININETHKIKKTVCFKECKIQESTQNHQDTVQNCEEIKENDIEEIRKSEKEVHLDFESTVLSTSTKIKIPQKMQEFRTPKPKNSQRFFITKKFKIDPSENKPSDKNSDINCITPQFNLNTNQQKLNKRDAKETEKFEESASIHKVLRSFSCCFKMQKIKENDFEDLDIQNDDDFNINDISMPKLRKRAYSECRPSFKYPRLHKNTTSFIINQRWNQESISKPSLCFPEMLQKIEENEYELSDPSESCASMVGLVSADLF